MFPAGCGSSQYWQTLTTQQGVPGGQQSIPCFLPSLVSLFFTCTSLTSISCSSSVPTSLMPASISSLSPLPFHLLATSLPTHFRINLSYKTITGEQPEHSCLSAMGAMSTQHPASSEKASKKSVLCSHSSWTTFKKKKKGRWKVV